MVQRKRIIIIFCFIIYVIGLVISDDYGLGWDEKARRSGALSHLKYVCELIGYEDMKLEHILDVKDHYSAWAAPYGMLFEFPSLIIEEIFNLTDRKQVFLTRHKLIFTIYFLGIIGFFFFAREVFYSDKKAIISALIYSLHPRIFAHGFFNPKDIIFMSLLSLCLYPILMFLYKRDKKWLIISSILIGMTMSIRIVGIYIPILVFLFLISNYFILSKGQRIKSLFDLLAISTTLFIISFIIMYILTPYFWENPIIKFYESFLLAKNHHWNGTVLFFGKYISAKSLPWFYLPIIIIITTPISFIVFFFIGIYTASNLILKEYRCHYILLFSILMMIIPPIATIVLNSTNLDGWRHYYFLYPMISLFISMGFFKIYAKIHNIFYISQLKLFLILTILLFIEPIYAIFSMHPNQQTYYNLLAGNDPMINFEGDYWGVSYKQGLEYILDIDKRDRINISVQNSPGMHNSHLIDPINRKRLVFVNDIRKADYYITNFRWQKDEYELSKQKVTPFLKKEIYSVKTKGMKILAIYSN